MKSRATLSFTLCFAAFIGLSGCQTLPTPPAPPVQHTAETNTYLLQGKIGVKTPQQSGSAFFVWQQQQDDYHIELSGILGVGKTLIQGGPNGVSLNSAKTGLIEADTPEELLFRATGWQAPITYLQHWIQGRPATLNAQLQQDNAGRHVQIDEADWKIQLSYAAQASVPERLVLTRQVADGEHRITMVIQQRQQILSSSER